VPEIQVHMQDSFSGAGDYTWVFLEGAKKLKKRFKNVFILIFVIFIRVRRTFQDWGQNPYSPFMIRPWWDLKSTSEREV